jgi:nucleoside-diphosphate-sugar epimerase
MALVRRGYDAVFHLAAVVSAAAEADFDLGVTVNVDGTRHLLEAMRHLGQRPRLVFASTLAVFGGTLPDPVRDDTHLTPQSTYGMSKAVGELLVADYARKGFVDGRSLRLPTIVVRPGRPNKAASSFASSILREPLNGEAVACPVPATTAMFILSPRRVVDALLRAMELEEEAFAEGRSLTLNGITVSVAEMLDALRGIAGERVAARVHFEPDPVIERIVRTWPPRFAAERARALGFAADPDIGAIIRQHIDDERGGAFVA